MRAHPYMFSLCYLRNYLQNRSPHKYSGDASDTLRRCATLCILFGRRSLGEDKLAHFARILLLLTLTLAGGCFQLHSVLKKDSNSSFPEVPFPLLFSAAPSTALYGLPHCGGNTCYSPPPPPHLEFSFEPSIQGHQEILFFKQWSFALRKYLILKFTTPCDRVLLAVGTLLYSSSLELTHLA